MPLPPPLAPQSVFFLFYAAALASAQYEEGDLCLAASGGNPAWYCKVQPSCQSASKLLKEQNKLPPLNRRCGFKGSTPVICCPPYEIADWSSTAPVTSETSNTTRRPPVSKEPQVEGSSKAVTKCKEFSKQIYQNNTSIPSISDPTDSSQVINCGSPDPEPLVVGGKDAKAKEFPHMALLGYGSPPQYQCGGSLISDKFVLSAAHCEKHSRNGFVLSVLLGDLDLNSNTDDATPRTFNVARRIVHSEYRPESNYNDIMLLELDRRVTFSLYIRPLCLHMSKNIPQSQAFVTGWGRTESVGPSSSILKKIVIPLVSGQKCNDSFSSFAGTEKLRFGILDDTQLCAGAEKDRDSCAGDSGGPLQVPFGDCLFSQVGIVSFGTLCGTAGFPGVYTRVSAFVPWIEKIVWP